MSCYRIKEFGGGGGSGRENVNIPLAKPNQDNFPLLLQ